MNKNGSIQKNLFFIALLPIFILSVLLVTVGIVLLYGSYTRNVQEELESTTNILLDCLDLTVHGDYSYENDLLYKGELNISDSTMLYRVKERSGIDTTIFWQDTRILTTLANADGVSAVGTKAGEEAVKAVLVDGGCYYSNDLNINGMEYIGYYVPLKNSDDEIVGMVFAGKNRQQANFQLLSVLMCFLLIALFAVVYAIFMSRFFSQKMIFDIDRINKFLATIANGDLMATLDQDLVERGDELGTIGKNATKMSASLKKLIETDPLTTLYNRRSCNNRLKAMEAKKTEYCVVMCDIDWFKKINDDYGHDAGDFVLVSVSELIRENISGCGFASRWGGEEFLLIYELSPEETKKKVEQLRTAIRDNDFVYGDITIKIKMTFGIESEQGEEAYEERIKLADNKLYIGKNNGRDQIVF